MDLAPLDSPGLHLVVASSKPQDESRICFSHFSMGKIKTLTQRHSGLCEEQMQDRTFTGPLMCVGNRNAACHTHFVIVGAPTGRCSRLYSALKQLFPVTLAEKVNTLVLFSAKMYSLPNIAQTEIPSDPLITTGLLQQIIDQSDEKTTSLQPMKSDTFIHGTGPMSSHFGNVFIVPPAHPP